MGIQTLAMKCYGSLSLGICLNLSEPQFIISKMEANNSSPGEFLK